MRLTSTVRNTVTCGAENALATIAAAVALRTPLIGMRRSPVAGDVGARDVVGLGGGEVSIRGAFGDAPRPSVGSGATAASTSSRVMRPSAPVPVMRVRSTPRLCASLRTGGVDTVCVFAATVVPARRSSGAVSRRGLRVGLAPVSTAGPYPTSTEVRSGAAAFAGAAGSAAAPSMSSWTATASSNPTIGAPTATVVPGSA